MNALKSLMMFSALLVCGASLAVAQDRPATGGQLAVADGTASKPAALGSTAAIPTQTARHHGTRHHRMYMMSVNRTHKGSKLTPAGNAKPQMKQ